MRRLDQASNLILDRRQLRECRVKGSETNRPPDAFRPLGQIGDGQRESRRDGERALLIEKITPVDGEEDLGGASECSERAAGNIVVVNLLDVCPSVLDAEQDFPLEAANERLAQFVRVGNDQRLQSSKCALRIAKRPAERDFAHPDRRAEAMGMSRLIIHAHAALAAVADDPLDGLDRPIEQVHLLPGYREPAAADDPRSPSANLREVRTGWLVHEALHDFKQARNVKPSALAEVKAYVGVRDRMRCAGRPRAAKCDGEDTGDRSKSGRDPFKERVGHIHPTRIADRCFVARGGESRLFPPAFPFHALARSGRLR
jgi:hypothetical protein